MISGIYTIENLIDGKLYVGLATDFDDRWKVHKYQLRKKTHHSRHLQYAWNKYGEENFKFEILVECEEQYLYSEEHYWCMVLDVHNRTRGYNIDPTHPYGVVRMSEETKKAMSKSQMGHNPSIETRKKISVQNKGKTGRKASDETRKKMSETRRGRKESPEALRRRRTAIGKSVVMLDSNREYIKTFSSISEVSQYIGKAASYITNIVNGKRPQLRDYILIKASDYTQDNKINKMEEINEVNDTCIDEQITILSEEYYNSKYNSRSMSAPKIKDITDAYIAGINKKLESVEVIPNIVLKYKSIMAEYFMQHNYRMLYEVYQKMVFESELIITKQSSLNKIKL